MHFIFFGGGGGGGGGVAAGRERVGRESWDLNSGRSKRNCTICRSADDLAFLWFYSTYKLNFYNTMVFCA